MVTAAEGQGESEFNPEVAGWEEGLKGKGEFFLG